MTFIQIGSDGGYLKAPVTLTSLFLAPAERADVIVDFSSLASGEKVILQNTALISPLLHRGTDRWTNNAVHSQQRTRNDSFQHRFSAKPIQPDPCRIKLSNPAKTDKTASFDALRDCWIKRLNC